MVHYSDLSPTAECLSPKTPQLIKLEGMEHSRENHSPALGVVEVWRKKDTTTTTDAGLGGRGGQWLTDGGKS